MTGCYPHLFPHIFVEGFGRSTREGELAQLFSNFGRVRHVGIVGGRNSYGIVTLACDDDVERILRAGQLTCRGRRLTVTVARIGEGRCSEQQQHQVVSTGQSVKRNSANQRRVSTDQTGANQRRTCTDQTIANQRRAITDQTVANQRRPATDQTVANQRRVGSDQLRTGPRPNTVFRTSPGQGRVSPKQYSRTNKSPHPSAVTQSPHLQPTSPVYYRHFTSPAMNLSSSPSPFPVPVPPAATVQSQPNLISYSCSPYQPLPLVFPIYHMDNFYMSMTPLAPGYCIQSTSSTQG